MPLIGSSPCWLGGGGTGPGRGRSPSRSLHNAAKPGQRSNAGRARTGGARHAERGAGYDAVHAGLFPDYNHCFLAARPAQPPRGARSLSGVWNRRGLERQYKAWSASPDLAVLMLDLNGLEAINDTSGHAAGDAFIRRVALALLERQCREVRSLAQTWLGCCTSN